MLLKHLSSRDKGLLRATIKDGSEVQEGSCSLEGLRQAKNIAHTQCFVKITIQSLSVRIYLHIKQNTNVEDKKSTVGDERGTTKSVGKL